MTATAAASTNEPGPDPANVDPKSNPRANPNAGQGSRAGRLLDLVRKLIDYGKELATTLQQRGLGDDRGVAVLPFGTSHLGQILASIARGLQRAAALEARLLRSGARLDAGPRPASAPSPDAPSPGAPSPGAPTPAASTQRRPRAARAAARDDGQADPGLIHLPSPEQIAAEVRRRPIGAVIADICRDLGIMPNHPMWRELQLAILDEGGSLAGLIKDNFKRAFEGAARSWPIAGVAASPEPFRSTPTPASTGPP
jgi:hypothetical protein